MDNFYNTTAAIEESVLGGLIRHPKRIRDADLSPKDFSIARNRCIFEAVLRLDSKQKTIDALEVITELERAGKLEDAGGMAQVAALVTDTVSDANLLGHAKLIKERSLKRQLIDLCQDVKAKAEEGISFDELLDSAQERILGIGRTSDCMPELAGNSTRDVYNELLRRQKAPDVLLGISTGLKELDKALNGLCPGKLYIVAARPSMGKSIIGMQFATQAAMSGQAALYISLEMPKQELMFRMISSLCRIPLQRVITADLGPEEWGWVRTIMQQINEHPLYIDESYGMTLSMLRSRARTLKKKGDLKLLVVDYIGLMSGEGKGENRNQELGAISRGLKALSKELAIPIIALSQLNRGVEQRTDRRPVLSDLRESGELEQDADVVIALYRDEVYDANSVDKGCIELLIRKHRSGALGNIPMAFQGDIVKISHLEGGLPSWSIPQEARPKGKSFSYSARNYPGQQE